MLRKPASIIIQSLLVVSALALTFNLQSVRASSTIYIRADGSIDPSTAQISTVDRVTYTLMGPVNDSIIIQRGNIMLDGNGHIIQGPGSGFGDGIFLSYVDNVTIKNAEITGFDCGIYLYASNNTATGNNVTGNNVGIGLEVSYNTLSDNSITENIVGISSNSSSGNIVSGNNITENQAGVVFAYCSGNVFYHNNFVNNTQQTTSYGTAPNSWDNGYPSGGNYWSNYTGADLYRGPYQNETGSDGIGDTPYIIDANNQDHYPLMMPWESPIDWWPMFHHDPAHTGYSTSTGPLTNQTLWTSTLPSGDGVLDSCPTVANGILYVGSSPGGHIYALNASNGAYLWNYTTGAPQVSSSPAVVDGVVYVGSDDYNIYALNATSGEELWNCTTGGWVGSSPAVVGGVVYVGSYDDNVYAVNASNGAVVWKYKTGSGVGSCPAVVGGVVYVGSNDHMIYALNATSGEELWSYATGGYVVASAAVANGIIYEGSYDGSLYALNAATGAKMWSCVCAPDSCPAVVGGVVFVGSSGGYVYALNAATGNVIWSYFTNSATDNPAVAGGVVYVGSDDGNVYALDATTGNLVWNFATNSVVGSSPTVVGGVIYIGSANGNVYAFGGGVHDVAVTNVASSKTVVCQGFSASINVTVANQGDYAEVFNVTAYVNVTAIQTETLNIISQNSTTLTFTLNITGFAYGNYTLNAYAWPVPGETNTTNNNYTDGWVIVSIPGDLTGGTGNPWDLVPDGKCDGKDIAIVALCFGSAPGCQPPWIWNPNSDVNNDGKVDGKDIALVALHYGQAGP